MKDFHILKRKKKTKNNPESKKKSGEHAKAQFLKKILVAARTHAFFSLGILLFVIDCALFTTVIFVVLLIRQSTTPKIIPFANEKLSYPYSVKKGSDLDVSSLALVVYEKNSRIFVVEKNAALRFSPASTAKIMSALVSLEYYPLDKVLIADNLRSVEGSKMGLFEGESMSVENLIYGMMLPSGNDAAYILAKNYPGGVVGFVKKMNEKALELNLSNTYFVDPAGYEDDNYTTANDLSRLASTALNNEKFKQVVGTKQKNVFDAYGKISHELKNLNKLLDTPGVYGIKTGFTGEAGGVLVTAYGYLGKTFIIVVLESQDRFADTTDIISQVIGKIQLIIY